MLYFIYTMRKAALGFTLIELLVVISIIGILATLVAANLNAARSRARDAERKSDLKNLQTALRLYYNDRVTFPRDDGAYQIKGCNSYSLPTSCAWGGVWAVGSVSYMSKLPIDPLPSQSLRYESSTTDSFTLSACLENTSDTSGVEADEWCPSGWMFQVTQ